MGGRQNMGVGSLTVTLVLGFREVGRGPRVEKGQAWGQENLAHILALQLSVMSLSPGPPDHLLTFLSFEVGSWGCCLPGSWGGAGMGQLGALLLFLLQVGWGQGGKAGLQPSLEMGFLICSIICSFFY